MKKTIFHPFHQKLNAKFVDFHGWQMPVQYSSVLAEHKEVRQNMGVFDVSHMGQIAVQGKDAEIFLNFVSSNDVRLALDNQVIYNLLLNEKGGIVDDVTVAKFNAESFLLVVNAANIEKDFDHLKKYAARYEVTVKNLSEDYSLLALQGPNSPLLMQSLVDFSVDSLLYYRFLQSQYQQETITVSRLGYTGEDGFEILLPNKIATHFWQELFEHGKQHSLQAIGLAARDTLRLEAGFSLYGNELTDQTTPYQANLGWVCKPNKGDFLGIEVLQQEKKEVLQKLVAFQYQKPGVARQGYKIVHPQSKEAIGKVTSGNFSPILKKSIGLGLVETEWAQVGMHIFVQQKDQLFPAEIVKLPFIKAEKPHYPKKKLT